MTESPSTNTLLSPGEAMGGDGGQRRRQRGGGGRAEVAGADVAGGPTGDRVARRRRWWAPSRRAPADAPGQHCGEGGHQAAQVIGRRRIWLTGVPAEGRSARRGPKRPVRRPTRVAADEVDSASGHGRSPGPLVPVPRAGCADHAPTTRRPIGELRGRARPRRATRMPGPARGAYDDAGVEAPVPAAGGAPWGVAAGSGWQWRAAFAAVVMGVQQQPRRGQGEADQEGPPGPVHRVDGRVGHVPQGRPGQGHTTFVCKVTSRVATTSM
jgi:hypothetical protein